MEFSIGGFNVKGWMVAVALPVLSAVSGGVYWGYDTLNRFYGVEGGVSEALGKTDTNAKQISEIQKSITKLTNDTEREFSSKEDKLKWKEINCPPSPTNFERFIESIESNTNHEPDFERGAEIQQILDKCYESSDSGKWLDI